MAEKATKKSPAKATRRTSSARAADTTEHFEVSFEDVDGTRRVANAHSPEQAEEVANGFHLQGLADVQVHAVTTARKPHQVKLAKLPEPEPTEG